MIGHGIISPMIVSTEFSDMLDLPLTRILVGDIMITEEERKQLGLSPDSLKIQHPKTGEWGYRAGVEVFHQLHCLNLLRQALYKKEYYGQKEVGGDVGDADGSEDLFGHLGMLFLVVAPWPLG